jgi:selenium-binding protein 1
LLQNFNLGLGSGPHMSMLVDNESRYLITDYFLDQDNLGKHRFDGDHNVHSFHVTEAGLLVPDPKFRIDFDKIVPDLKLRPHGAEVSGMTAH